MTLKEALGQSNVQCAECDLSNKDYIGVGFNPPRSRPCPGQYRVFYREWGASNDRFDECCPTVEDVEKMLFEHGIQITLLNWRPFNNV